jgi:hypothetical protein
MIEDIHGMRTTSSPTPAIIVLFIWAAVSAVLSQEGFFTNSPDQPPIMLLLGVLVPPILFGLAYLGSDGFRSYVLGLDLRLLTAIQAWRIIGGMFLVLMSFGMLPGTFAWPAGIGDMIVGIYAPFVVYALVRQTPNWRRHVVLLSVLGLLDFVGAIGGGVLSGNNPLGLLRGDVTAEIMQVLPLVIIPTFGVPAWILVHVISLLKVSRNEVPELGLDS